MRHRTSYFSSTWLVCVRRCVIFPSPAATDHHSVEQREATTQSEQMASHARPPHCNRRQEEGEGHIRSQPTLTPALTFEWQQDKLTVAQSLCVSVCFFLALTSIFLSPGHVYLKCSPIRAAFAHRIFFFFLPSQDNMREGSLVMIYCNIIIPRSNHSPDITEISYCISLPDHQSVSTSRCHRDRSSTKSGRGYSTTD